jgi:hypothetical protein
VIDEDIETARETKTFDGIEAEIAKTLVLGTSEWFFGVDFLHLS